MKRMKELLLCIVICLFCTACSKQSDENLVPVTSSASSSEQEVSESTLPTPEKLEVSGNRDDIYVTESDCYIEGESVFIYLQKGLSVPGDILVITEMVMQDLCEVSGFTFEENYVIENPMECRDMYYEPGLFMEINKDAQKINVLVVDLEDGYVEWATDNTTVIDIANYDYEYTLYQTLYHELAHVLHSRNGVMLSSTLNEGYATYLASKTLRAKQMADWNTIQYFFPAEFDDNIITQGEAAFLAEFQDRDLPYQYGFRLLTFLTDTYGDDIFAKILAEATRQEYDSGYDPSNQEESIKEDSLQLISIIKSQTTDDVFEQFSTWYKDNWNTKASEYMSYIEAFEQ